MKLTHLTIAVSVALGLAACGGSDSNDNAVDNSSGTTPGAGAGAGTGTTTPPTTTPAEPEKERPEDPKRADLGYEVEKPLQVDVELAKVTYASAAARDILTGYAPNAGIVAQGNDPRDNPGWAYVSDSTDAADVKRLSSAVNYLAEKQIRSDATNGAYNGSVLANPGFTYAQGSDGIYYRMQPANGTLWNQTTPSTQYVPVSAATNSADGTPVASKFPGGSVSQDKLVYLPNVTRSSDASLEIQNSGLNIDQTPGGVDQINPKNLNVFSTTAGESPLWGGASPANGNNPAILGGQVFAYGGPGNPDRAQALTVDHGEVVFNTATFNGKKYDISSAGQIQKVDLNNLPYNKPVPLASASNNEIQYLPVTINYSVIDNKATGTQNDDASVGRDAKAGAMKAYNLPYSLAFVTVNQKGAEKASVPEGAAARNLFDYPSSGTLGDLGPYQVVGSQTPFLPENGRADYYGKSFGVDSQGDIHLRADFGYEGAHIGGSVSNRTHADGKTPLPEISLANIALSQPARFKETGTPVFGHGTPANPTTSGGAARSRYQNGGWEVQLFGPDAVEAGGFIAFGSEQIIPGNIEVFTSKRTEMSDLSNIKASGR